MPLPQNGATGLKRYLGLLETATVCSNKLGDPAVGDDKVVVFCTHCLKRDKQLMVAAAVNCCLWWPLRKYWRLVIVTFGDDVETMERLQQMLAIAIECGNVVLASGGEHARFTIARGEGYDKPVWMPTKPLAMGDEENIMGMPMLRFWHASVAKNTSHMCGIHCFGENTCLVNLDCDQIVPLEYLHSLLRLYTKHSTVKGWTVRCSKVAGTLTGRIAYRATDWLYLRGYDEFETPPSGGQDVDMRTRCEKWGAAESPLIPIKATIVGEDICGGALPNDFDNTSAQHDRGWSKVKHVDPAVLEKFKDVRENKVWIKMNEQGWHKVYGPRIEQKIWRRNEEVLKSKLEIGAWFIVIEQHVLPQDRSLRKPTQEQSMTSTQRWLAVPSSSEELVAPSNTALPNATSVGSCTGYSVEIVVVPGSDLVNRKNTENTCLGLEKCEVNACLCMCAHVAVSVCVMR